MPFIKSFFISAGPLYTYESCLLLSDGFFLCIAYLSFCILYYKEYEQKAEITQKEQFIQVIVEQQKKELDSIKRNDYEIKLLRHDMRLFLNNLSLCIDQNKSCRSSCDSFYS